MDSDNNVYIKRGKKYIPFGVRYNENYLPDGIWLARHFDLSYGKTNVDRYLSGLYKVGECPDYIDIPTLCSEHLYTEYVLNSPEFTKLYRDDGYYTFTELVAKVVALVLKLNKTLKDKEKNTNGTR